MHKARTTATSNSKYGSGDVIGSQWRRCTSTIGKASKLNTGAHTRMIHTAPHISSWVLWTTFHVYSEKAFDPNASGPTKEGGLSIWWQCCRSSYTQSYVDANNYYRRGSYEITAPFTLITPVHISLEDKAARGYSCVRRTIRYPTGFRHRPSMNYKQQKCVDVCVLWVLQAAQQ